MSVTRSRARQFCEAVSDQAGGWGDIAAVGARLGLGLDRAIVLAEAKRGRELPDSVTLSAEGWELMQPKARTARR